MNIRYAILQRTPRPGIWEQVPIWRVQLAEFNVFHKIYGDEHYNQRALKRPAVHPVLLYKWEDAQMLIDYMKKTCPWAAYKVLGFVINNEKQP